MVCPLLEKMCSGCHDFHGHLEIGLLLFLMKRLKKRSSRDLFCVFGKSGFGVLVLVLVLVLAGICWKVLVSCSCYSLSSVRLC